MSHNDPSYKAQENEQLLFPVAMTPSCSATKLEQHDHLWQLRYKMSLDYSYDRWRVPEGFFAVSYPASLFKDCVDCTRAHLVAVHGKKNFEKKALARWGRMRKPDYYLILPVWPPGADLVGIQYFSHKQVSKSNRMRHTFTNFFREWATPLFQPMLDQFWHINFRGTPVNRLLAPTPIQFTLVCTHTIPFELELEFLVRLSQIPAYLKRGLLRKRLQRLEEDMAQREAARRRTQENLRRRNSQQSTVASGGDDHDIGGYSITVGAAVEDLPPEEEDDGTAGLPTPPTQHKPKKYRAKPFKLKVRVFVQFSVADPSGFLLAALKCNVAAKLAEELKDGLKEDNLQDFLSNQARNAKKQFQEGWLKVDNSKEERDIDYSMARLFAGHIRERIEEVGHSAVSKLQDIRDVFRLSNRLLHTPQLSMGFLDCGLNLEGIRIREATLVHDRGGDEYFITGEEPQDEREELELGDEEGKASLFFQTPQ